MLLASVVSVAFAGRAPDKSPEIPDGFCEKPWGTMTRSTGECMCHPKATCEGRNCESGQGMIWWVGAWWRRMLLPLPTMARARCFHAATATLIAATTTTTTNYNTATTTTKCRRRRR